VEEHEFLTEPNFSRPEVNFYRIFSTR
jgi:hypothetical protein